MAWLVWFCTEWGSAHVSGWNDQALRKERAQLETAYVGLPPFSSSWRNQN